MTEEEGELVFELKEKVAAAVKTLTAEMLEGVDSEIETLVRLQLNDTFRFWR